MKKFKDFGRYFGYPKCCIDSFCSGNYAINITWVNNYYGTGFVPCKKCSELPIDKLINIIDNNRQEVLTFREVFNNVRRM